MPNAVSTNHNSPGPSESEGPRPVSRNAYDAFSRRVLKVTPTETHTFLYDGWNVVREVVRDNATGAITETRDYYWGRDLSGSLQGAGGVGGLLAYTCNGALRIPVYDHIGNIVAVVDSTGATIAAYEYDPFGNIIAKSGAEADEVPFRFSTKYFDSETGVYYYGYRFYSPELGRWINRDPIEEHGGLNLYSACNNAHAFTIDRLGYHNINEVTISPVEYVNYIIISLGGEDAGKVYPSFSHEISCVCIQRTNPTLFKADIKLSLRLDTKIVATGVPHPKTGIPRTNEGVLQTESHEEVHRNELMRHYDQYKLKLQRYLEKTWVNWVSCTTETRKIQTEILTDWKNVIEQESNHQGEHWKKWFGEHKGKKVW